MFEEFEGRSAAKETRRFGASLAVSVVVYAALGAGVVAASAAARQIAKEEELVQVEFAPPPEPPPEAPPPPPPVEAPPPSNARPKAERAALELPTEIPDEKPEESDAELKEAPEPGAGQDGFTDGVAGGTGTQPAPAVVAPEPAAPAPARPSGPVHLPESASPPVPMAGNAVPSYPEEARKSGVQAVVIAKIIISADGRVTSVDILRGPEVFHASVKAALMSWRFEPAKLPDGTTLSVFKIVTLPFKLDNM